MSLDNFRPSQLCYGGNPKRRCSYLNVYLMSACAFAPSPSSMLPIGIRGFRWGHSLARVAALLSCALNVFHMKYLEMGTSGLKAFQLKHAEAATK